MKDRLVLLASQCYGAVDRRAQLLVMTYHAVGADHPIRPDTISAELAYLKRHYNVILPSQWDEARSHHRTAMVTVDDGHISVYETLFPIAREIGVPLTLAIPTDFVLRGRWLWFDKIRWLLERITSPIAMEAPGTQFTLVPGVAHGPFMEFLSQLEPVDRDRMIDEVITRSGTAVSAGPVAEYRPVPLADLRTMLASGLVELCSHSVTHSIMTRLSDQQLEEELVRSRVELEALSGAAVVSFCYPNGGRGDFDARTRSAIARAGYRIAFTTIEGLNRPPHVDMLELRRIHAHPRYATFRKLASGLADLQRAAGLGDGT